MSTDLALRLAHDVGKYVSRMARNLPPDTIEEVAAQSPTLIDMLLGDVYGQAGTEGARSRALGLASDAGYDDPRESPVPTRVWDSLDALADLRARAEARDGEALAELIGHALAIDEALRQWVNELAERR